MIPQKGRAIRARAGDSHHERQGQNPMSTATRKPATDKQTAANRKNAEKSTGPRTQAGKDASRTNSLKHGLTATKLDPVRSPGETPGLYRKKLDHWFDDMRPQNVLEMAMIE